MALRIYEPISPSIRHKVTLVKNVANIRPEKSLTTIQFKNSGRSLGKVTVYGKGGGHKRRLRMIDFKRDKRDINAKVASIEYDPNRSTNIALVIYIDGEKRYILAPDALKAGDTVVSSDNAEIKPGNSLPLLKMPVGTIVHNVELVPGRGGQIVRSAGAGAIVSAKEGKWIHLKLPSKEVRKIHSSCFATVGQLSNIDWKHTKLGKAGVSRHMGRRPKVRGVAMDPRSHPHGGGEGKSGEGMHPKTRWGKSARGTKTRTKKKPSGKFILERRIRK